jgi:hypothetical protein
VLETTRGCENSLWNQQLVEETTLEQLDSLCDAKHDALLGARIPRNQLLVETPNEVVEDKEFGQVDVGRNSMV